MKQAARRVSGEGGGKGVPKAGRTPAGARFAFGALVRRDLTFYNVLRGKLAHTPGELPSF
jgi:hypothetical protein